MVGLHLVAMPNDAPDDPWRDWPTARVQRALRSYENEMRRLEYTCVALREELQARWYRAATTP